MEDPTGDLAKMFRQMDSVLSPPREFAIALEDSRKSMSAVSEYIQQQERIADYAKQQALLPQPYLGQLDSASMIAESFRQTASEISRAAEFARSSAAYAPALLGTVDIPRLPQFDFPAFPWLTLPQWPVIDWEKVAEDHSKGVLRMADCGWTAAAWMSLPDISELGDASDDEIDDYFVSNYLGAEGDPGELGILSNELLTSSELLPWRGLLEEVFSCFEQKRYKVCVPALVTVIEGFTAQCLCKQLNVSRREVKIFTSLKKAGWHEEDSFTGIMWLSVVTFLDHLFAHSDFESTTPQFINRHWILHGRSATEWTEKDALKLANALATLHWLAPKED